jgi:hypothetical protein
MNRITLRMIFGVFLAAGLSCASNTLSGVDEPDFDEVVRHYRTLQSHKVLALATEADGHWAYGVRFASDSQQQATLDAVEACRSKAMLNGMRAPCILFAIENQPAPDTVEGCLTRMIPSRRCAMQRRHYGALTQP